jgi:hypothetical protein
MSIYVNNAGVWTLSKDVYVNDNGTWKEPQEVYINNNGTWTLSHKVLYIVANAANVNLHAVAGYPSNDVRLKVIINAGVTLYGSNANTPALNITGFNPNSQILLINNGSIIGAGGNGASGSTYGAGFVNSAQTGGTAINTANYVTIQNNGTLAGGGGGGGQGGWGTYTVTSCFPADTMVSTPQGLRPIQDIKVGDEVYAFDAGIRWGLINPTPVYDNKLEVRKVAEVSKHGYNDTPTPAHLIKVIHSEGELVATYNHEVHTLTNQTIGSDPGFVRVEELIPGDIIFNEVGKEVTVIEVIAGGEYDYVYNLEVEELHTYIANGIRVHNGGTTTTSTSKKYSSPSTYSVGGSGGGGGAGNPSVGVGGAAGGGGNYSGSAGAAGSASAGGAGGVSTGTGFRGGNGGAIGQAGATGSGGSYWAGGGGAGRYIVGNSLVTWEATGTRIGAVG